MHILYLDESGTHKEARCFVVAGLSLFERQTFHLAEDVNRLQTKHLPDEDSPVELHASGLRAPDEHVRPPLDKLDRAQRRELLDGVYETLAQSGSRLFAVAIDKAAIVGDPYEHGFEQIVSRFDYMLSRVNRERDERNRGLVVLAESSYRENLEALARQVWAVGHKWGEVHNIADIPYFAPARNTRLLQLADFVVNAVYGRYEHGYTRHFDKIAPLFDQEGGRMHGLLHVTNDREHCYCPACVTRRVVPLVALPPPVPNSPTE